MLPPNRLPAIGNVEIVCRGETVNQTKTASIDLREEWCALQRRIVALIESDQRSDFGDDVLELDPRVYTDPERFKAERQTLFMRGPMLIGLSSEVSKPGDRLIFDAAGPSILVIRGEDGVLRAFLNMCTHRGAQLVSNCDRTKRLLCPFHGWAFDLEGRLAGMPMTAAFEGVDRESRGLVRVPVVDRHGMIFVRVDPNGSDDPGLDIDAHLGPIAPLLAALGLGSLCLVRQSRLEVQCNWKLALDMGRENYHVPVVHRNSLALNLYPQVTVTDCYGPHSRFSGAGKDFAQLVGRPECDWPPMHYQAVHYLFPNTTMSFTHAFDGDTPVVTLSRVFPGKTIGEAVTLISTYRCGNADDEEEDAKYAEMHGAVVAIVGTEDYAVARKVWQSIEHGIPPIPFVIGRNELLVQRYHREIANRIGMPLS